jgi:molecular chaperone HscA
MLKNEIIFGIDFGTTYTVVSWIVNGEIQFLNIDDSPLIRTEINGISNLKRILADFPNETNQNLAKKFFVKLYDQLDNIVLGLKSCVLTVPVRFNDIARNAIKIAAISAGFHVIKLLVEPVSAAIGSIGDFKNCHFSRPFGGAKNGYYLVYDLGGGTFDATLLNYQNGVFQVIAIDGMSNFGGVDIDVAIAQHFAVAIDEAQDYKKKCLLSSDAILQANVQQILQPTYEIIFNLLSKNNLAPHNIEKLILAGGSTRISFIQEELAKWFNIVFDDNQVDLLVAIGAAKFGYYFNDVTTNNLLIDVAAFDLGIETLYGEFEPIIRKNSPLPMIAQVRFQQTGGQTAINVMQKNLAQCVSLKKFIINTTQSVFDITFMLDCDGVLSIKIEDDIEIVSAHLFEKRQRDRDLVEIYESIKQRSDLTHSQNNYLIYIKQAMSIDLEEHVKQWLLDEFRKRF